jgi:hypothetical protein
MIKKITLFSLVWAITSLVVFAQKVKPTPITVDSNRFTKKIIIGEAIQDDDEENFRFTEERSKARPFYRKDLYLRYEDGTRWLEIGKRGKNVEKIIANNPEALKEFKKYKRKTFWGGAAIFVGGGIGLGVSIATQNFLPVIILLAGSGTGGILLETGAEKHLYKAIEIYNASLDKKNN